MKAGTLQIVWHGQDPVYSLDFHPSGLLATAGGDKEIKIWALHTAPDGTPAVSLVAELQGHARSVNCVRWSPVPGPNGSATLVSAGDGGEVFLWRSDGEVVGPSATGTAAPAAPAPPPADPFSSSSRWRAAAVLRGHSDDVFDAAWAPDGSALATASLENLAILWDVPSENPSGTGAPGGTSTATPAAPRARARLDAHRHYVQGVAWDPAGVYVATQAADRSVRIYGPRPPAAGKRKGAAAATTSTRPACSAGLRDLVCHATLARRPAREGEAGPAVAPAADGAAAAPRTATFPLFADEQLPTFFRRLGWSPDGGLLAVPAGLLRPGAGPGTPPVHAAYLYARGRWGAPAVALPSPRPVVAVRFCPVLFEKNAPAAEKAEAAPADGAASPSWPFDDLPYRMVYALATLDGVTLYDTASPTPLAFLGGLHMAPVTDLAWATDGSALAVSSYDSYCSVVAFEAGELGTRLGTDALPPHLAARVAAAGKAGTAPAPPTPAPGKKGSGVAAAAAAAATAAPPGGVAAPPPRFDGGSTVKRIQPTPVSWADAGPAQPTPRRIAPEPLDTSTAAVPPPGTGGPPSRRIAPEPITAAAGAAAPPAPSPRRRIVPEAVGGGGAGPAQTPTPRRVVPEPVAADAGVTVTAAAPAPNGGSLFSAGGIAAAAAKAGAEAATAAAGAQPME